MFELILCAAVLTAVVTVTVLLTLLSRRRLEITGLEGALAEAEARHRADRQTLQQALHEARRPVVIAPPPDRPRALPSQRGGAAQDKRVLIELVAPPSTPWRAVIDRLEPVARTLLQAAVTDDLRGLQGWNGNSEVGFAFGVAGTYPYPTLPRMRHGTAGTTRSESAATRALLPVDELVRKARLEELQANYLGGAFKQLQALREAAEMLYRLGEVPGLDQRALLRTLESADLYLCKFVELVEPAATGEIAPPIDPDTGITPPPGALPLDELYQRLDGKAAGACPNSPLAVAGDGAPPRQWQVDTARTLPEGGHPLEPVYETPGETIRPPVRAVAAG
ncbi:hypothetical protein [Coralloluteibacterium thermophilus]|uniref:Secreted protein n=1 Tax=Coralloluteibacterium thermophilum TaxID=2707049 RepID=A0ABV9NR15_9GAMM